MASSPPRAPRRFLFDLNVAQEEFEEEPEEAFQEVVPEEGVPVEQPEEAAAAVEDEAVEEVIEHEEEVVREEPADDVTMEEEEEAAAQRPVLDEEVMGEDEMGDGEPRGRKKRIEYEVVVGGLPQDAAEEDIAKALAEAGDVEEVRLMRDPADQRLNKGFALVRFAAAWQARWAANDLREAKLAENLKPFELENLDRINLIEHPERKGKNRGYAFLDFRTHVDAVAAFLKLQERDLYLGTDFRAHISFSNTLSQDDEIMEKVKSVFLDGLPPHWDEDKVREMFGKFGEIDNIQLARNMFTAKRKDFGFIGFMTRKSALDCIKMVNKEGVGEGSGKVLIKACLQRPRHTFKKHSWQGSSSTLGVRRGFIDKNSNGRGHHLDRYRHFERRVYSDNHDRRYRSMDIDERPVSPRGYREYYRRDSAAHECNLRGQNCDYPNGEEFSATSGCEQAYYKTDRDHTPSTSQVVSHCEDSCCKVDNKLISKGPCDCDDCYIEQESTPSPNDHTRTRSNLHRRSFKSSREHRRFVADEHSAFEVEYTARENRSRYSSSSRDAPSTHSKKHHRPAR
nr:unnamed protein product [Digitaria exilis]